MPRLYTANDPLLLPVRVHQTDMDALNHILLAMLVTRACRCVLKAHKFWREMNTVEMNAPNAFSAGTM